MRTFFRGGGETADLIAAFDWAQTSVGAIRTWRATLKSSISLVLGSPAAMVLLWGPEGYLIYNDAFSRFAGARHPEGLGKPVVEAWPEVAEFNVAVLDAVLGRGETLSYRDRELQLDRRGSPEPAWMDLDYSPVLDDCGERVGVIGIVSETTQRVLAERDLAAERDLLALTFQQAPTFKAIVLGPDHVIQMVNHGDRRLIGDREVLGKTVAEALPEAAEQGFVKRLDVVFRTGRSYSASGARYGVQTTPGGPVDERFLDFLFQPIKDPAGGGAKGIFVEGKDVTDQVRADAALRASEARLKAMFETTNLYLGFLAPDGRIVDTNAASLEGIGARLEDVVGQPFWETPWFSGTPGLDVLIKGLVERVAAGATVTQDLTMTLPTGIRMFELSMRPVNGEKGAVVGIVVESIETTARLLAEEAVRQSQKIEALGQLTGGVAHDFNNLLTPIIGSLDMLQRRGVGTEREQALIEGALVASERARTLVERLLAFARRQPLRPKSVDIAKLVEGIFDLLSSSIGPRIHIDVRIAPDLPPAMADANQIEMALLNLCVNARDAMPDGGTLTIAASLDEASKGHRAKAAPGAYILLSVTDTGTGMDAATLQHAFDPFFSTKEVGKGTGLGLSMVHGLAHQLGGVAAISSSLGVGTTVELWLPASDTAVEAGTLHAPTAPVPASGETVLLVDDEDVVRANTAAMLEDMGYLVVQARSAEIGQSLLDEGHSVDLLITDHLMPGMSGADFARGVRQSHPRLPVLILSGYSEASDIASDMPLLSKPFRSTELLSALSRLGPLPPRIGGHKLRGSRPARARRRPAA